jgi:hypothetical protein
VSDEDLDLELDLRDLDQPVRRPSSAHTSDARRRRGRQAYARAVTVRREAKATQVAPPLSPAPRPRLEPDAGAPAGFALAVLLVSLLLFALAAWMLLGR